MLRMKYSKSTMWIQSDSLIDQTLESKMPQLWAFSQQIFLSGSFLLLPIATQHSLISVTLELLCSRLTSRSILSHCICSSLHWHPLYYTEGGADISLKKQKAHLCGYSICHVSIHAITYKEKAKEYYYNSNAGLEEVKGRLLAYCV